MRHAIIFAILLLGTCGYALVCGNRDAKVVGLVCILASFASFGLVSRYSGLELGVLLVDLIALAVFVWVALDSTRFWLLWVSGLQLTTLLGHAIKLFQSELVPIAYAAALRMWSDPILLILVIAVWRGRRRPQPAAAFEMG